MIGCHDKKPVPDPKGLRLTEVEAVGFCLAIKNLSLTQRDCDRKLLPLVMIQIIKKLSLTQRDCDLPSTSLTSLR